MSKVIKLTNGYETIVDDADYEFLKPFKWFALKSSNNIYAVRHTPKQSVKGGKRLIRMHRVIMNQPANLQIDHINGDALDNRRSNLRICTRTENNRNQKPQKDRTSKYKGVYRCERAAKWCAKIKVNGRNKHLGYFHSEIFAAYEYDKAARKYFGEFARPNFGIANSQ